MELTAIQQISDQINRSRKILLALPLHVTVDRLAGAYALSRILGKLGKETTVASSASALPNLNFVPDVPEVISSLSSGGSLVVSLSTLTAQLSELSYQAESDRVDIFLKAKNGGEFTPSDITVHAAHSAYDLVIILGAQTLEDLGALYQNNTDLFFNVPKINIDTEASNEYFGTVNFIDVTASSIAEMAAEIIDALEQAVTDSNIATSLLGGIIDNTHSFQDPTTTPKTLTTASALIAQGARQQDVIKSLYKTKDFSLLKLWGRALARIKTLPEASLLYSLLTKSDFEKTGEDNDRLMVVLKEILENVSGFQTIVLLGEQEQGVRILIAGLPHAKILNLARKFSDDPATPTPLFGLYQVVSLDLGQISLNDAEQKLIQAARES